MDNLDDKQLNKLGNQLRDYRSTPSTGTWSQIDNRLEHLRSKKRIRKFKNLSIAASLLAIVSVVSVMSLFLREHNPDLFATSPVFQPVLMESISESNDEFYNVKHVNNIFLAYKSQQQQIN